MTGRANDDLQPLLVTAEEVELLRRFLRRKYRGSNGIRVEATPDVVDVGNALGMFPPLGLGGGTATVGPVVVRVKQTGGAAGSVSSPASWTYDIWPVEHFPSEDADDAYRIAGGLQPQNRSNQPGRVLAAVTDSLGLAFFNAFEEDEERQWVLLIAYNERFETNACSQ